MQRDPLLLMPPCTPSPRPALYQPPRLRSQALSDSVTRTPVHSLTKSHTLTLRCVQISELEPAGKHLFFPDNVINPKSPGLLGPFVPRACAQRAVHTAAGLCAFRLVTKNYDTLAPFRRAVIDAVVQEMPPTSRKVCSHPA